MTAADPVDLMFGGMEKLGPGDDALTLRALRRLPRQEFGPIVDAGCGTGRQTIALTKALAAPVDAVDSHAPFLADLRRRAAAAGVGSLVRTHVMDMRDIPAAFSGIDLLWSEGAAYNIGFANALDVWRPAIRSGGFLVVSELMWLGDSAPQIARDFFSSCYPDMRDVPENRAIAEKAGYDLLDSFMLPKDAWTTGYYDILGPRAKTLLDHPDPSVRDVARATLREIEVFDVAGGSYGYVFLILRRS